MKGREGAMDESRRRNYERARGGNGKQNGGMKGARRGQWRAMDEGGKEGGTTEKLIKHKGGNEEAMRWAMDEGGNLGSTRGQWVKDKGLTVARNLVYLLYVFIWNPSMT